MLTHQQQNQRISPSANNNYIAYLNHPQKYHTIFWSTNNIIKWYFHQPREVLEGILVYQKVSWDILIHQHQNVSLHEQQHRRVVFSLISNQIMPFIFVILIIPSFRRLSDLTENKCWQIKFYFSQIKLYSCQLHSYFSEILFTLRLCLTSSTNKRLIGKKNFFVITFDRS